MSSISSTMTITDHQSRKPSRRTSDFHFNENSISELEDSLEEAEAVWDYSSWDCQEELTFKAGDVIKVRHQAEFIGFNFSLRSLKNAMTHGGGEHVKIKLVGFQLHLFG